MNTGDIVTLKMHSCQGRPEVVAKFKIMKITSIYDDGSNEPTIGPTRRVRGLPEIGWESNRTLWGYALTFQAMEQVGLPNYNGMNNLSNPSIITFILGANEECHAEIVSRS